jgi:hypothetical protein
VRMGFFLFLIMKTPYEESGRLRSVEVVANIAECLVVVVGVRECVGSALDQVGGSERGQTPSITFVRS